MIRNPVLHEPDPVALRLAAETLRDRTMTLEPIDDPFPAKRLMAVIAGVVAAVAVGTVVFRVELKTWLGLM